MNLLNALAEAQGGQGLNNLAQQFGLTPQQTQSAVGALIPQIVSGMQGQSGGLGALIGMLGGGTHAAQVADQSGAAFGSQGVSLGNEVLGQIFGSKEVSRGVAANVSQQTGVGADVLRKMLPVVVTMGWARSPSRAWAVVRQQRLRVAWAACWVACSAEARKHPAQVLRAAWRACCRRCSMPTRMETSPMI